MKAIVFEDTQDGRVLAKQWNGRGWMPIRRELADERIAAGEAYHWPSRRLAYDYAYIPPDLRPTIKQRRSCRHDWVFIRWRAGYDKQSRAAWNYRCRKCGGYAR